MMIADRDTARSDSALFFVQCRASQPYRRRFTKLSTNFHEILSRAHGNFERKNTILKSYTMRQLSSHFSNKHLQQTVWKNCKRFIEIEYSDKEVEEQAGFRAGKSCNYSSFVFKQPIEKRLSVEKEVHLLFIDLKKAYYSTPLNLWPWKWTLKQQHINYVKREYFTNQRR